MKRMQAHTVAELMHLAASAGVLGDLRRPTIAAKPEPGSVDAPDPSGLPPGDPPT
jgi:hypothetical protein